ncbi:MAG: hypothetical protein AB7P69_12090 [Candidatus Binatia bacterium]
MINRFVCGAAISMFWMSVGAHVLFADDPCQEAQDILGLSVSLAAKQEGGGLVVSEIAPLSLGARLGLLKGDIVEQINSWQARDCQSYSRAVQDARGDNKAVLLLIKRKGKRQTLAFEPEIWARKEEEKKEKEAVASLQTMLEAPLPADVRGKTDETGAQALLVLRKLAAVAVLDGKANAYEKGVTRTTIQLLELDQASQGEAEKRVVAGAKVLLGYYLTAQEIRQYKQEFVSESRKDLRKGRAATFVSSNVPYFLKSPVPGWVNKYSFLQAAVKDSPTMLDFLEQPGHWDPDKAVELLWDKAKEETENFAKWLGPRSQQSAISNQQEK